MSNSVPVWINGNSCCGKTTRLAFLILEWIKTSSFLEKPLILCANRHSRKILGDTLVRLNPHLHGVKIRTIFGLMREDVMLFYPLICEALNLPSSTIPFALRPEIEQELATELWHKSFTPELLSLFGCEYDCVRGILDFMMLAATGGVIPENIVDRLSQSNIMIRENSKPIFELIEKLILQWRYWCLERGLLSYSLQYELYGRYLLPHAHYQQYLKDSYGAIFADDVDDYPAIFKDLAEFFLHNGYRGAFSFNATGKVRLGYNADPDYLQPLANYCHLEFLSVNTIDSLGSKIETSIIDFLQGKSLSPQLPPEIITIKTDLRGDLLQETADYIIKSVDSGEIQPRDVAVIAAGLDEVARYILVSTIEKAGIKVKVLNEQRELIAFAPVRSILTILPLLYEDLGRFVTPDMVAEMLVIFSQEEIDLVRAGLLADSCFYPDLRSPTLLNVESFRRWDRLSHKSLQSYNQIRDWINQTKTDIQKGENNLLVTLDRIIQRFFTDGMQLNSSQISILKKFRETAQHFGEIQQRLHRHNINLIVAQFISLLRKGTITANPFPMTIIPPLQEIQDNAVSIASIYQYRISHQYHRWQFWLDVASSYWSKNSQLFASGVFLKSWHPNSHISAEIESEDERITRIVKDLLGRVTEKVFLCHSNLDVNGIEQKGKLFPLIITAKQENRLTHST